MRRLALILAPAIIAATCAVPVQAQEAAHSDPIACIYRVLRKPDYPMLVKVARQGLVGETADEKAEVQRISDATNRCRVQYGWGKKKQDAALRWFVGRVLAGDTTFTLKAYGLDFEKLKALVAKLDGPTRAAYLSGKVTNEQSQATFAALASVGVDISTVPEADRAMFGQKLSQGILGLVLQIEAEAAFSA